MSCFLASGVLTHDSNVTFTTTIHYYWFITKYSEKCYHHDIFFFCFTSHVFINVFLYTFWSVTLEKLMEMANYWKNVLNFAKRFEMFLPFYEKRVIKELPNKFWSSEHLTHMIDQLFTGTLLSEGKETNQDSLSSGERRGKSPALNPYLTGGWGKCGVWEIAFPVPEGAWVLLIKAQPVDGVRPVTAPVVPGSRLHRVGLFMTVAQSGW